jgi:hypothetical protein
MVFGDPRTFAIECKIVATEPYLVGQLCIWAGCRRIGDYEQLCSLAIPAEVLRVSAGRAGLRHHPTVDGAPPDAVLSTLFDTLYGEGSDWPDDLRHLWEPYRHLLVCPNTSEAFDGERMAVLDDDAGVRLIWRDYEDHAVREMRLPSGEYERRVEELLGWLADQSAATQSQTQRASLLEGDESTR